MQIGAKKAVTIHYTLKDDKGEELDSSDGGDPLVYLHGEGNIVPGLEKALEGKQPGDEVTAAVSPAEGYGERDEKNFRNLPVRKMQGKVQPGMQVRLQTGSGSDRGAGDSGERRLRDGRSQPPAGGDDPALHGEGGRSAGRDRRRARARSRARRRRAPPPLTPPRRRAQPARRADSGSCDCTPAGMPPVTSAVATRPFDHSVRSVMIR